VEGSADPPFRVVHRSPAPPPGGETMVRGGGGLWPGCLMVRVPGGVVVGARAGGCRGNLAPWQPGNLADRSSRGAGTTGYRLGVLARGRYS
jgi:hypothetical protein